MSVCFVDEALLAYVKTLPVCVCGPLHKMNLNRKKESRFYCHFFFQNASVPFSYSVCAIVVPDASCL